LKEVLVGRLKTSQKELKKIGETMYKKSSIKVQYKQDHELTM